MSKFAFVSAEQANHAVSTLCRVVGVSVSGFYAWLQAIPVVQRRAEITALAKRNFDPAWASPLGVEGLLRNPRTPGGGDGRQTYPAAVHAGV